MLRNTWDRYIEIRKIPEGELNRVVESLKYDWKEVMAYVPRNPLDIDSDEYEYKYTVENVNTIEDSALSDNKNPVALFLDEWKTSGRIRPTLSTLQKLVTERGLYGAMVEMALLLGDPVPNRPANGPGAPVDTDVTRLLERELDQDLENMGTIASDQLVICSTYNKNVNVPQDGGTISKSYPNFVLPEIQQSTETTSNNQQTESIHTVDLPAVLQDAVLDLPEIEQQSLTTQSAITFDSSISSQDELSTGSNDIPEVISSMNKSAGNSCFPAITSQESADGVHSKAGLYAQDRTQNLLLTEKEFSLPLVILSLNSKEDEVHTLSKYNIFKIKKMTRSFAKDSKPNARIGGLIAEGGSSEVYVGFDVDVPVAIKRLVTKRKGIDIIEEYFQSEINMIKIKHPNLVKILGFCSEGPERVILSEYIEGGTLRDKLNKNNDDFNPSNRQKVLIGTAKALQYLHCGTSEMIHKDVKSVNILLTSDYEPKLCDFGLVSADTIANNMLIGTRVYLAPEAYTGSITSKMDIYGFGIVILEILTGLESVVSTESESIDIKRYISNELSRRGNMSDISPLLKYPVRGWNSANKLYKLAEQCLADLNNRLDSNAVCEYLYRNI